MEKLKQLVSEIAYTQNFSKLSPVHCLLIPLLSAASSVYALSLSTRQWLYSLCIFRKHSLPVPVISVGNLTWGGNGKTPMVEFLSLWFSSSGISPLILSRGYAGGDEVKMLERHLLGTSVKFGIGANRAMTATSFLERYGYIEKHANGSFENLIPPTKSSTETPVDKIGVVILDDGMQHVSLSRDLEIVLVNGLMQWGNGRLIPRGPLREPLHALKRADVVVIHHADLVSEQNLINLKHSIQEMKENLPVFFSRMAASHFFTIQNTHTEVPLSAVGNKVVLCVSAIASPDAFVKCIEKVGPFQVDKLHFSDHYLFQPKDICLMKRRLEELWRSFGTKPIVVTTEKDYDRDRKVLLQLHPFDVLVLCSRLQIVPYSGNSEEGFKQFLVRLLELRLKKPEKSWTILN